MNPPRPSYIAPTEAQQVALSHLVNATTKLDCALDELAEEGGLAFLPPKARGTAVHALRDIRRTIDEALTMTPPTESD